MSEADRHPGRRRFGVFELNLAARELRKHGIRMHLSGQPFEILALLLERPGAIVTREQLQSQLWPADTFVDFEHSLNTAVKKLRVALGDSRENSRYIETVPRVGYRFIAPVTPFPNAQEAAVPAAVPQSAPPKAVTHRRLLRKAVFALTALIVAGGAVYEVQRRYARTRPPERARLAVLPFQNLSADLEQEYFSDGLTEEMIAQLGRVDPEHLGVIARTSVMHYKNSHEKLEQIGNELGVQYVLEGSVRRDADKVRISAQLIQMKDQTHIWARQYDREEVHLLTLQSEIAREIADEIRLAFGGPKPVAAAAQPLLTPQQHEAYDLYLRGRFFWNKRTVEGFRQAAEYFQQAIAKDPNSARGYAGLADTFGLMSTWNVAPQNELMPKARAAAVRALELDESLAEAHASLGLVAESHDYDWQTAEKEFRRAIQLNPDYATGHQWYAEYLSWQGRFNEAFSESERARQLDPLSPIIATDHCAIFYFSRQYDRAIAQCRAALEMDPSTGRAQGFICYSYVAEGKLTEALAEIEKGRSLWGDGPWYPALLAYAYGRTGRTVQAKQELQKLEELRLRQPITLQVTVMALAGVGDAEKAVVTLEKAYSDHLSFLTTIKVDPAYDPLRGDPRFQNLLRRVGLAQ